VGEQMTNSMPKAKSGVQTYRELVVCQKGMDLCEICYRLTARLPKGEIYGLVSQIRRAAVSVPSNIAEGFGRDQSGSFIQFLRIGQGSLKELETQVLICQRVGLLTEEEVTKVLSLADELGRMIRSLIRTQQTGPS
jgi:four helix bundle protein